MSTRICLFANAMSFPEGGGLVWEYLNWALGLRGLGCKVTWLEAVGPDMPDQETRISALHCRLERYGFADSVAICSRTGKAVPHAARHGCLSLDDVSEADLLINMGYRTPPELMRRFRRSMFVDVDPGLTQIWMSEGGGLSVAPHDLYFTTGETVGRPGARFPDLGLEWHYTPPCVALEWWPRCGSNAPDAAFTTISQWYANEWVQYGGELYSNNKREGFLPFLDMPRRACQPLELALCLAENDVDDRERAMLRERGWRVRDAHEVSSTPWEYQGYIQSSLGEFSCAKPSCIRLQNAWVSDRTICYLASGKPAVVQHTGPSRVLPDATGLFRFTNLEEAGRYLAQVMSDYGRQCKLARGVAEEYFDAKKNLKRVLETALS
jgi:hypothetical protein